MRALAAYDWPGNVRELENVLERAWSWPRGIVSGWRICPWPWRGGGDGGGSGSRKGSGDAGPGVSGETSSPEGWAGGAWGNRAGGTEERTSR
jgi:hypothetical protein